MKPTKTLEKEDDIKKFYICIFCYKANDRFRIMSMGTVQTRRVQNELDMHFLKPEPEYVKLETALDARSFKFN